MFSNQEDRRISDPAAVLLVAVTTGCAVLSVGMLATGTATGHMALLAWGVIVGGVGIGVGSAAAIRLMIDGASRRVYAALRADLDVAVHDAVTTTAVQVGQAIADGLRDEDGEPKIPVPVGVRSLR